MTDQPSADQLKVDSQTLRDNTVLVKLVGEIDLSTAGLLADELRAVAAYEAISVVLDATEVTFMDSTGLHALVEGKRMLHEKGSRIYLVPSQQVRRVLELVFPDPLFASRLDSVDEALHAIDRTDAP